MSIRTRAAICFEAGEDWQVEEIDLDPPKADEVLVRMGGAGLCHSDEHIITGDLPYPLPIIGGHEGAGVVEEVGPGVTAVAPGDHVVFSFLPVCGRCPSCSTGHQNLCDLGMYLRQGKQVSDHTARHHLDGRDLNINLMLGTFAERTVASVYNCVKIDKEIPLDVACLLGCSVGTGWGAVVNTGEVRAGDTVVVVGIGGVGINAVQGAAMAGAERILAIDPVEFKRQKALEFGATHTAADWDSAFALLQDLTWGRLAHVVVLSKSVGESADIGQALRLTAKRGKVVVANLYNHAEDTVSMRPLDLVTMEKQIRGTLFGSSNPLADIPRLLGLYRSGQLKLEELRTHRYGLEEINQGYDDMRNGRSLRGVLSF